MAIYALIFTILANIERLHYSKFYRIQSIEIKIMVTNIYTCTS